MTDSEKIPRPHRRKLPVPADPPQEAKKAPPAQLKRRGRPPKAKKGSDDASVNIGVKVNQTLWRRLRALALRQGVNTGELLDKAIEDYVGKHEKAK